jgi:hypothetical protein
MQASIGASPLSFAQPFASACIRAAAAPTMSPSKDPVTYMTAAQQHQWQRKSDEAMKIFEKTTPALAQ